MKRIGFDFDGVLANTNILKREWFLRFIDISLDDVSKTGIYNELSKMYSLDEINDIYRRMGLAVFTRDNLMKTIIMDENIPKILELLTQHCELIIITNRPLFMLEWVRDWLEANGIDNFFCKILSSCGNTKGEVAVQNNVSVLIDDDINNLRDSRIEYNLLFGSSGIKDWSKLNDYIVGNIVLHDSDDKTKKDKK